MAAESSAEAGDGGGSAAHGTGNLAMGGAGLKEGSDGTEELRALEVIEQREAVLGEGAAAAETEKARDAPAAKGVSRRRGDEPGDGRECGDVRGRPDQGQKRGRKSCSRSREVRGQRIKGEKA